MQSLLAFVFSSMLFKAFCLSAIQRGFQIKNVVNFVLLSFQSEKTTILVHDFIDAQNFCLCTMLLLFFSYSWESKMQSGTFCVTHCSTDVSPFLLSTYPNLLCLFLSSSRSCATMIILCFL